jgi:hypothetical protein
MTESSGSTHLYGLVVNRSGLVLAVRHHPPGEPPSPLPVLYQLVGGEVAAAGIRPLTALQELILESTGLDVLADHPLHLAAWWQVVGGITHQIAATYVLCWAKEATLPPDLPDRQYEWVDPLIITSNAMNEPDYRALQWYLRIRHVLTPPW